MKKRFWIFFILTGILIFIDQMSKVAAATALKGKKPFELINGVLEFRYIENRGAAWGMLQGAGIFFIIITAVILVAVIYLVYRIPDALKFKGLFTFAVLLFAGGIGNLIDRIFLRYVRDFIYVSLINFPVFNVADICVTVAICVLVLAVIFVYREKDYDRFKRRNGDVSDDSDK